MKINVVIIGLGNIGRWHLKAVSQLSICEEIFGYDQKKEALENVLPFCKQNGIDCPLILVDDFDQILNVISSKTIVIVATTAKGREHVLRQLISCQPLAIIAEKPLCQTEEAYGTILRLSEEENVPVYVNFTRRMYPFYQKIYDAMKSAKNKSFHARIGGGIGCIGIHMLDLIVWLLGADSCEVLQAKIEGVYETERDGYYDFSGDIILNINDCMTCSIVSSQKKEASFITISNEDKQYQIYESMGKMVVADTAGQLKIEEIEIINTSQLTNKVIEQIAENKGKVELPNAQEAYLGHKILFDCLKAGHLEETNFT